MSWHHFSVLMNQTIISHSHHKSILTEFPGYSAKKKKSQVTWSKRLCETIEFNIDLFFFNCSRWSTPPKLALYKGSTHLEIIKKILIHKTLFLKWLHCISLLQALWKTVHHNSLCCGVCRECHLQLFHLSEVAKNIHGQTLNFVVW